MKKFLALTLSVLSIGFAASSVEAKAAESPVSEITAKAVSQIRVRIGGTHRRRRRVVRTTRVSPNGRRVVTRTYRPNGQVVTRKRVIRRNRNY